MIKVDKIFSKSEIKKIANLAKQVQSKQNKAGGAVPITPPIAYVR